MAPSAGFIATNTSAEEYSRAYKTFVCFKKSFDEKTMPLKLEIIMIMSIMLYLMKIVFQWSGLKGRLPVNVHVLSFERWHSSLHLLRLEHFYEKNEDKDMSRPATVSLKVAYISLIKPCICRWIVWRKIVKKFPVISLIHDSLSNGTHYWVVQLSWRDALFSGRGHDYNVQAFEKLWAVALYFMTRAVS